MNITCNCKLPVPHDPTFAAPPIGARIAFYGKPYMTVTGPGSKKGDGFIVPVKMDNGVKMTVWWCNNEGCQIISCS